MSKVWVAHVITDSTDHYNFAFATKPTAKDIAERLAKDEGNIEDVQWYEDTCCFYIDECEVETLNDRSTEKVRRTGKKKGRN